MIEGAKSRGHKVMYIVLYLHPGNYHRYHSPALFMATYRRHIAGYCLRMRPEYLKRHKNNLKDNERVSLLGQWEHCFIGAMKEGAMVLLFDDDLVTNIKNPEFPYISDKSYSKLA